ncbi:major capsid protein [Herbiconiux sp. UC225_62]|uniref:major capsid protein n=1 Tax=Herbiconiux sp. UC225_62 TaxID=3350168 RepID=UPI0036D3E8BB
MGVYNDTFRTAADLTAVARGAADAVEAADALTPFLPSVESQTLDFDLDADVLALPRSASFRSFDAAAPFGKEKSVGSRKGSLPAASIMLRVNELDQLRFRQASDDAIGASVERKALLSGQSLAIRAIFARGDLIANGSVTLTAENGLTTVIDFGRPGGNTITAGTVWSNIASTPLTDILSALAYYNTLNGGPTDTAITSTNVLNALAVNTSVIAAARGSNGGSGLTRIAPGEVLSVLAAYGLTDVVAYDKQYEDVTGTTRRVIPNDRFILVPSRNTGLVGDTGPVGQTLWGVPAEALEDSYGIGGGDQAGIFAAAFKDSNPERIEVLASSIFLPVGSTAGVKGTVSLDVL